MSKPLIRQRVLAVLGLLLLAALNGALCGLLAHSPLLAFGLLWSAVSGACYGVGVLYPAFRRSY